MHLDTVQVSGLRLVTGWQQACTTLVSGLIEGDFSVSYRPKLDFDGFCLSVNVHSDTIRFLNYREDLSATTRECTGSPINSAPTLRGKTFGPRVQAFLKALLALTSGEQKHTQLLCEDNRSVQLEVTENSSLRLTVL